MSNDDRFSLRRATRAFQDNVRRSGSAAGASYTLTGAILVFGAMGYLVDQWRGTGPRLVVAGLLLGIVVGFYELIKATRPR
jgi:F0F1-type ATP synthase assembly protein I